MQAVSRSPGLALLSDSMAAPPSLSVRATVAVLTVFDDTVVVEVKMAQASGPRPQPSRTKAAMARAYRRTGRCRRRLLLTASALPLLPPQLLPALSVGRLPH